MVRKYFYRQPPISEGLSVFISSRVAGMRYIRDQVLWVCEDLGLEAELYPEDSPAGSGVVTYEQRVAQADIVVSLLTEDSEPVLREREIAREKGKPIVLLAPLFEVGLGNLQSTEDARRAAKGQEFVAAFENLPELERNLRFALTRLIARRFSHPKGIKPWGKSAYMDASELISGGSRRFAVLQQTSSLVLGPRADRDQIEGRFLEGVREIIDRALESESASVLIAWSEEATLSEISENALQYPRALDAMAWLEERIERIEQSERVFVGAIRGGVSPVVIRDETVEVGIALGDRYYLHHEEVGEMAESIWRELRGACDHPLRTPPSEYLATCRQLYRAE